MLRSLRSLLILVLLVIITIVLLRKTGFIPSFKQLFSAAPLQIDRTPVLVKEIRELASLVTITAHDEVVVDSTDAGPSEIVVKAITGFQLYRKLVLIAKGQVICGTDLKKINDSAIHVVGDSVHLQLPRAEILEIVVNPSGFETFIESGSWTNEAVTRVKIKAREKMRARALQHNILTQADERAKSVMTSMLEAAGFRKIAISLR